jgi:putative DNA primase/helicase
VDYDFHIDAGEPTETLKWLESAFPGDPEAIDIVQEIFGYCIDPSDWTLDLQKILLIAGPTRSGKGTMQRLLKSLMGKHAFSDCRFGDLRGHFDLAKLVGKQIMAIADARTSSRLGNDSDPAIEVMLNISGRDAITIRRKYLEDLELEPRLKQLVFCNQVPQVRDSSTAMLGRLVFLAMSQSFLGREDHDLERRLKAERPAILLWAIAGARRLKERGYFVEPRSAAELREEAEDAINPIIAFARDVLEFGPDYTCKPNDLFYMYQQWFEKRGLAKEMKKDINWFGRDLATLKPRYDFHADKNTKDKHGKTTVIYKGVRLKPGGTDPELRVKGGPGTL